MRDRLWRNWSGHYKGTIIGGVLCGFQVAATAGWWSGLISLLIDIPTISLFAWADAKMYPQARS